MNKKCKVIGLLFILTILTGCGTPSENAQKKEKPQIVTIWSYYNGPQKEALDDLVYEFNETVGEEKGVIVEVESQGTIEALQQAIQDSAKGKVGSSKLPQMAIVYPDIAFELDKKEYLADIKQYMTEEELQTYVEAYLQEGDLLDDNSLKVLPTAKSTEVLTLNSTEWERFEKETEVDIAELATWEGIARVAEQYYRWTDSKTPEPNDGKAFFGRDAMANYMLVGGSQLGHDIFGTKNGKAHLDFHKDTMKKLWDCYYLPYIKGYYTDEGRFRSDDLKTGNLIAYIGSTSGAAYTPDKVVYEDGSSEKIVCEVLPLPNFENTKPVAVQQGGGMVLFKGEEKIEQASAEFLKWFTKVEANTKFCIDSGYLPVCKEANNLNFMEKVIKEEKIEFSEIQRKNLTVGMDEVNTYRLYTTKPFRGGNDARKVLESTMTEYARTDRQVIKQWLEDGLSLEQAIDKLNTEDRFLEWYQETYYALLKKIGK